jgi:hypothetical protein
MILVHTPLTKVVKEFVGLKWNSEQEHAFNLLKKIYY